MRLSPYQRDVIHRVTSEIATPLAKVYVFGSRARSDLRGGDIDLLIELPQPRDDCFALGIQIGARIERQLGQQRLDILVADPRTPDSPVLIAARRDALLV